jgi:serine-type D-Ala-D-Ala carboxypeptidase (penicillin-binding protein 5/6)
MSPTALGPTRARTGYRRHRGILALLAALACLAGCTTGELTTSPSSTVTPPAGTVTPGVGTATPSQEKLGAVSWPADGTSAADISGIGVTDGPGATRQVPIASVAKLMTAYVILQDHPLPAGGSGPDITVEPSEAAAYPSQARDGDSLVAVAAGEAISERHALEALLLPSADNMAWILARWDAGSQAAIVDMLMGVVPVAGVVRNTNTLLGQDGIVGLKTGSTQAAGGCLLIAAWQEVSGRKTLIVAATFGQPGTAGTILPNALQAGHSLVLALDRALAPGVQSGSRDDSEGPSQGPRRAP